MAAEIILSAFLPVILEKVTSAAIHQLCDAYGADEKLQKLKRILQRIQSVLVDAEERQNAESPIKDWLSDLKDFAYEAEDLLEEFDFEVQRKQRLINDMIRKVLFCCFFYKPIMTRFSLCRRLNEIIKKIEAIADEIHKFNFQLNKEAQISYGRPQTHSYVDKEKVIGREEDKEKIVKLLIDHDVGNSKKILVLPIVAMGGMGKTTISKLVYGDNRVENIFSLRIWVCVSDPDFDVAQLARLIIEAATKTKCEEDNMELLQQRLREIIYGKKYLVVLDDVWNENMMQWNELKELLDCGGEGSAVIVSTRSTIAAKMMATHTIIYDLKQLPEEDSWELFRRKVFANDAEEPANLVKIGKDIMKRCGGLPLAISALGSMLYLKNEKVWKDVLDSELWKTKAAKDNILPALRLSYDYLPSHLKQCFAFCAIYPKDHKIEKETLIHLWISNGYIPSDGKEDLESMGEDIFDELIWRSFFQNVEEVSPYISEDNLYGHRGIVTCKMHDLMHDLVKSIMGKECLSFAHAPKWEDIPSTAKHLLAPSFPKLSSPLNQYIVPTIRTIVRSNVFSDGPKLPIKYSRLKSLRVLSYPHVRIDNFDKIVSVKHLRHLRLLDISGSHIKELPEGICSLYNLQTLKLSGCFRLKKLPDNLTDLVHLRHLYIDGCHALIRMPRGMMRLKQLHKLTMYVVSAEAERGLQQLGDLKLGGKLELYGIEKVSNAIDAEAACLSSKQNLHSIRLSWNGAGSLEVFQALKPHDRLRMLDVSGYGGQQFPRWMNAIQQLPNLVQVRLYGCRNCKELPPLGQLQFLEILELSEMDDVKHIISKTIWCNRKLHATLFPSLKVLRMISLINLEEWLEAEGNNAQNLLDWRKFHPCLMELFIQGCKNLTAIPTIPSLERLFLSLCSPNITNLFLFTSNERPAISQLRELSVCQSLIHLPTCLPSIRRIQISECDGLVSLPIGMENLTFLRIAQCKRLTSLPEGLIKLHTLDLESCNGLASLPQGMDSLTVLRISGCKGLTSLPEGLIKLRSLNLIGCDGLVSLPRGMECLTQLERLNISFCNRLKSLPEGLHVCLPNLTWLTLFGHDELIRPFQVVFGEYWHLIENIPHRDIIQLKPDNVSSTSGG